MFNTGGSKEDASRISQENREAVCLEELFRQWYMHCGIASKGGVLTWVRFEGRYNYHRALLGKTDAILDAVKFREVYEDAVGGWPPRVIGTLLPLASSSEKNPKFYDSETLCVYSGLSASDRLISKEKNNKLIFTKMEHYAKSKSTNFSITASVGLASGGGYAGALGPEASVSATIGKSWAKENTDEVTLNFTFEEPSDPNQAVHLKVFSSKWREERKIRLSGHIVYCATNEMSLVKDSKGNDFKATHKHAVSIWKVITDLKNYNQENFNLHANGTSVRKAVDGRLNRFTPISEAAENYVDVDVECKHKEMQDYRPVLCLKDDAREIFVEGKKEFNGKRVEDYETELEKYAKGFFVGSSLEKHKGIEVALEMLANQEQLCTTTPSAFMNALKEKQGEQQHILITGAFGMGKSWLCKQLTGQMPEPKKFKLVDKNDKDHGYWIFQVSIDRLASRYPKRQDKPYTLAEIVIKESCEAGIARKIMQSSVYSVWCTYLESIIMNDQVRFDDYFGEGHGMCFPKSWVVVDAGKAEIPEHLENVVAELMTAPNVILVSESYVSQSLKERFAFVPGQHFDIKGFEPNNVEQYIKAFFSAASSEKAQALIDYLNKTPYAKDACQKPGICHQACVAWASGELNHAETGALAQFYDALLQKHLRNYVERYKHGHQLSGHADIYEICRREVAFPEVFALQSFKHQKQRLEAIAVTRQIGDDSEQSDLLKEQYHLGIISMHHSPDGKKVEVSIDDPIWQYFCLARSLATAFQKESDSKYEPVSASFEMSKNAILLVDKFIAQHMYRPSFERILWLISGLLAKQGDIQALRSFFRSLLTKQGKHTVDTNSALILMRCVEEAHYLLDHINQDLLTRIFEVIHKDWKQCLSYWDKHSNKTPPLWEQLRYCRVFLTLPYFSGDRSMIGLITDEIKASTDADQLETLLSFLTTIDFLDEGVTKALFTALVSCTGSNIVCRRMFVDLIHTSCVRVDHFKTLKYLAERTDKIEWDQEKLALSGKIGQTLMLEAIKQVGEAQVKTFPTESLKKLIREVELARFEKVWGDVCDANLGQAQIMAALAEACVSMLSPPALFDLLRELKLTNEEFITFVDAYHGLPLVSKAKETWVKLSDRDGFWDESLLTLALPKALYANINKGLITEDEAALLINYSELALVESAWGRISAVLSQQLQDKPKLLQFVDALPFVGLKRVEPFIAGFKEFATHGGEASLLPTFLTLYFRLNEIELILTPEQLVNFETDILAKLKLPDTINNGISEYETIRKKIDTTISEHIKGNWIDKLIDELSFFTTLCERTVRLKDKLVVNFEALGRLKDGWPSFSTELKAKVYAFLLAYFPQHVYGLNLFENSSNTETPSAAAGGEGGGGDKADNSDSSEDTNDSAFWQQLGRPQATSVFLQQLKRVSSVSIPHLPDGFLHWFFKGFSIEHLLKQITRSPNTFSHNTVLRSLMQKLIYERTVVSFKGDKCIYQDSQRTSQWLIAKDFDSGIFQSERPVTSSPSELESKQDGASEGNAVPGNSD